MVKCQPFHLPRRFSAVIVTAVYIPPQNKKNNILDMKNNKLAHNALYEAINKQDTMHPQAAFLVASDFNSASLRN